MRTKSTSLLLASLIAGAPAGSAAQDVARVYDQGPVVTVGYVKVEPGQFDAYMANLNGTWRRAQEDAKRRGEVLDYKVLSNMSRGRDEPDLMLVVTYKNAAVLDTSLDELDKRTAAMQGSVGAANQALVQRAKLRTIMANEMYRELPFKAR